MKVKTTNDTEIAITHLAADPFENLMTLKMLSLFPGLCTTTFYGDASAWACRTELGSKVSAWDRNEYPHAERIVMLDGNSPLHLEQALLDTPTKAVVFKLHDEWSRFTFANDRRFTLANSFESYSDLEPTSRTAFAEGVNVEQHSHFDDEAAGLFKQNGYVEKEFRLHLDRKAQWFAVRDRHLLVSTCLAFQNYDNIWEIGGVMTRTDYRRRGYARAVVSAALNHLAGLKLVPRYQFHHRNDASRGLAKSLGMTRRLTVDHYVEREHPSAGTIPRPISW